MMRIAIALVVMLLSSITLRADQPFKPVFTSWQAAEPVDSPPPEIRLICFSTDANRPQAFFKLGNLVHCRLEEQSGEIKKRKWKFRPPIPPENFLAVSPTECIFTSPIPGYYEIDVTVVDAAYEIAMATCRVEIAARESSADGQPTSAIPQTERARAESSVRTTRAAVSSGIASAASTAPAVRRESYDPDILIPQWASEVATNNRAYEATMVSKMFAGSATLTNAVSTSRAAIGADGATAWAPFFAKVEKKFREMKADLAASGTKLSEANFVAHVAKALEQVQ